MTDTDSTPEVESAGEASTEFAAPELETAIESALDEHFESEPTGPVRDPDTGKFVSTKEPEDSEVEEDPDNPSEAPQEAVSDEGDEDQEVEEEAETEVPPLEPPAQWSAADKEAFYNAPRDAQEFLLDRHKAMEADYTRKTQEIAPLRQRYQQLEQVVEPLRQSLSAAGINEAQYIQTLVNADRMLQQNPTAAIQQLAQQAGIDLATLEPGVDDYVDPQVAALQNQLQGLQAQVQQQGQAVQQARQAELTTQIDQFAQATDGNGNPAHPHFEAVREVMGALVQMGQASTLDDAYSKAVRLDDNLYQQTLESERKAAEAAEEKRRLDAVNKAKKVRRVPSGAAKGSSQPSDLDGLLNSALDQHGL